MATKEFPLSIILRAIDRATAPIARVGRSIGKIGSSAARVGRSLTTNLTLPIVGIGAAAVSAMSKFETGMANVSTLIDTTAESLDDMGKEVLKMSRKYPVQIDDLTGALFDVRSAGISAADQFRVLEGSAKLGVAGLGSTKQSVDLVTSSLNAFQLQGQDAARLYDVIFKTTKNGKTTIEQLAVGFGGVAGTVAATGTEIDEFLASVAALTTTGVPASQAYTQLRAVIAGLTRDTEDSRKVFRALGAKDFKGLIAQSGGMVPALQRISAELGGNDAKILKLVGSTEALGAVISLTGAQNEAFTNTLKDMREGANALDGAVVKQNKTTRAQWQRTKNALTGAGISIGRVLTPALEKLAGVLQGLADWFGNLDDSTKEWIVRIGGVVAVVGPVLMIVGKLAAGMSVLFKALVLGAKGIRILTVALISNPIGALVAAIAAAALLIISNWGPIGDFFSALWDGVTAAFSAAWAFIKRIVGKIVDAVNKVIAFAKKVKDLAAATQAPVIEVARERLREEARRRDLGIGEKEFQALRRSERAAEQSAKIVVDFSNAPRGTRVQTDPSSTADVNTSVGYQMGLP